MVGNFDPALCSGSTFDSLTDQMRQASDIMADGSQDPNATCNAISIGIGLDMSAAKLGSIAPPVTPPVDPCL